MRLAWLVWVILVSWTSIARAGVDEEYRHGLVSTEALGAVGSRYGFQVEAVFTTHDSVTGYGWFLDSQFRGRAGFLDFLVSGTDYDVTTHAAGVDLQYRHYFRGGTHRLSGANGFFVAPGFEFSRFRTTTVSCEVSGDPQFDPPCQGPTLQSWWYVGPSLDLGGQLILAYGLVLAVSGGVHVRIPTGEPPGGAPWIWSAWEGPGPRPRFRVSLGWAFF